MPAPPAARIAGSTGTPRVPAPARHARTALAALTGHARLRAPVCSRDFRPNRTRLPYPVFRQAPLVAGCRVVHDNRRRRPPWRRLFMSALSWKNHPCKGQFSASWLSAEMHEMLQKKLEPQPFPLSKSRTMAPQPPENPPIPGPAFPTLLGGDKRRDFWSQLERVTYRQPAGMSRAKCEESGCFAGSRRRPGPATRRGESRRSRRRAAAAQIRSPQTRSRRTDRGRAPRAPDRSGECRATG